MILTLGLIAKGLAVLPANVGRSADATNAEGRQQRRVPVMLVDAWNSVLSACSVHPSKFLRPVAGGRADVDMLGATTIALDPYPNVLFSGERGFTSPSKGDVLAYNYDDHHSTTVSSTDLRSFRTELARDSPVSEVSILAHSMRNWLVLEALGQMAIRNSQVNPRIKKVLLAAAELDIDVARKQVLDTSQMRPRSGLFISRLDKAFDVSKST